MNAMADIWYQKDVLALLRQDVEKPPPQGAVVFTGSSIFRFWVTLERDMSPLPVTNRAFGGARTWEVLHFMDRLILPLNPAVIVYYCGSNDIEFGGTAEDIAGNFKNFCSRAAAALPAARIFFVSIIKAPQKTSKWAVIDAANGRIKDSCSRMEKNSYIEINHAFFTPAGLPRSELYSSDGLHLMPDAYRRIAEITKPEIERAFRDARKDRIRC